MSMNRATLVLVPGDEYVRQIRSLGVAMMMRSGEAVERTLPLFELVTQGNMYLHRDILSVECKYESKFALSRCGARREK
jgi:hypothetical protein